MDNKETRILSFDGDIVKGEKVETFAISKTDVEARKASIAARKAELEARAAEINGELNALIEEETRLAEAEAIIAKAKEQFMPDAEDNNNNSGE
jgi:hypothetical protein